MNNISRTLYVGKIQNGKWACATNESPYLFFEGESENEVAALGKDALDFCFSTRASTSHVKVERPDFSLSQFFKKRTEKVFPHIGNLVPAE